MGPDDHEDHLTNEPQPLAPGQRFAYWLAKAAVQAREDAHADIGHVLVAGARLSPEQLKRFEKGARNWPRDPERLIAAYAKAAGLDDPRQIFESALDLWHKHGQAPTLDSADGGDGLTTGQRYEREIASRRDRPRGPVAPAEKTSAAQKRSAGR